MVIKSVWAREVLDSRGFPTLEVELFLDTSCGSAMVPSGASTGEGEALELRDKDPKRYFGKGVLQAVANVREKIAPAVLNQKFESQSHFDEFLIDLDGTPNKSKLGANAILGVSLAFACAKAKATQMPLYSYLASLTGTQGTTLPVPLMNILNGGKHADNGLAIQEFMIVPCGFQKFSEALRAGVEVFHHLKGILQSKKLSTGLGDEGGFAPFYSGEHPHEQALETIAQAIEKAGYRLGHDIFLALDSAASEFTDGSTYQFEGKSLTARELISVYEKWVQKYSILSLEDALGEHDWEGWGELTRLLGGSCQLVGDDLFVTNKLYLQKGIEKKVANAILIKLNQIGTVTETLKTMQLASRSHYRSIVSHRSGETEDTFIADLCVATDCGQIKTGSASRTDRIAKYNRLIRIEEELGTRAQFLGFKNYK